MTARLRTWVGLELVGRHWKWALLLTLALLLAIGWWVGLAMLPHHVLNTYLRYNEKNGIREFRGGVHESP